MLNVSIVYAYERVISLTNHLHCNGEHNISQSKVMIITHMHTHTHVQTTKNRKISDQVNNVFTFTSWEDNEYDSFEMSHVA